MYRNPNRKPRKIIRTNRNPYGIHYICKYYNENSKEKLKSKKCERQSDHRRDIIDHSVSLKIKPNVDTNHSAYNWVLMLEELKNEENIKYSFNIYTNTFGFFPSVPSLIFQKTIQMKFSPIGYEFILNVTSYFSEFFEQVYTRGNIQHEGSSVIVNSIDIESGGKMNIFCDNVLIKEIPKRE